MDAVYVNDAVNAVGQNSAEHVLKNAKYAAKTAEPWMKPAVKKIPAVGLAFALSDIYSGAGEAKETLGLGRAPTAAEKAAGAAAELANSFSWGVIPKKEAAKGLADLLTGSTHAVNSSIAKAKQKVVDAANAKWLEERGKNVYKSIVGVTK